MPHRVSDMPALREFHPALMGELFGRGCKPVDSRWSAIRVACLPQKPRNRRHESTGGNKPAKKNHCGFVACGGDGCMPPPTIPADPRRENPHDSPPQQAENNLERRRPPSPPLISQRNGASSRERADWGRTQGESVRGTGSVGGGCAR